MSVDRESAMCRSGMTSSRLDPQRGFRQARRRDRDVRSRRRRLDSHRRHGRPLRAEPHVRREGHRDGAPAARRCRSTCISWSSSRRSTSTTSPSAGASGLTIHAEAAPHLHRQLDRIRELGCRAGVALNPATPLSAVCEVDPRDRPAADHDGESGLRRTAVHSDYSLDKIRRARLMLDEDGSDAALEVDGGVSRDTIQRRLGRRRRHVRRRQRDLLGERSAGGDRRAARAVLRVTRMTARQQWTVVGVDRRRARHRARRRVALHAATSCFR